MTEWSLKDAKEHLAEVVSAARKSPQLVTDGNGTAAVVIGPEEYARLTGQLAPPKTVTWNGRQMTLVEHLMAMPWKEGFEIERVHIVPRDVEF